MPPSAASRSSAAIAAGAMHRCLWLQHKPLGAAQRGGHRRWLLHSTGAHIAFGGLAQRSGHRRLRRILLPFWLRCTPPCGITGTAANTALAPCCRTQLKRVWRHSCSAAAHSALGSTGAPLAKAASPLAHNTAALGCSSRHPWRPPLAQRPCRLRPYCRTRLWRTPPSDVAQHSSPATRAHAAAFSCSSRRPWRRNSAWQPRRLRPRCGAQLRRTLPSAASPGVAAMPLASHTAAFSCVATQLRGDSGYPLGRCPGDLRLAA